MSLNVLSTGEGPPLLLLHGFSGSARSWEACLPAWSVDHRIIAPDLLGHGRSDAPADPARYALSRQAADLAELLLLLDAAPAAVVGYSMGARLGLVLAVEHPELVERLFLESPSAGIVERGARAERRAADERLAHDLERDGLAAFVDRWEALPLFASHANLPHDIRARQRAERLAHHPRGLAGSLRGAGQGAMPPLHAHLASIAAPTLVIAGELDGPGLERARDRRGRHPRRPTRGHRGRRPHTTPRIARGVRAPRGRASANHPCHELKEHIMPIDWTTAHEYEDIRYEHSGTGIAKITIDRAHVRNAFRPETVTELIDAFRRVRDDSSIGVVLFTGAGDMAFCSGGDMSVKGDGGYIADDGTARLNVLDLQRLIRSLPIVVIALVNGYAIGGGHVLHVVCDLTIASENAVFGQTGPRVGSFDGGYGADAAGPHRGPQEGSRDVVPVPPVQRRRGARHGPRQHRGAARPAGGRGRAVGRRDPGHEPDRDPHAEALLQRRHRRTRRVSRSWPATPPCSST